MTGWHLVQGGSRGSSGRLGLAIILSIALHGALVILVQPAPWHPSRDAGMIILNTRIVAEAAAPVVPDMPAVAGQTASPVSHPETSAPVRSGLAAPAAMPPAAAPGHGDTPAAPLPPADAPSSAVSQDAPAGLARVPLPVDPTWYTAGQVDVHPRALQPIQPLYPQQARRNGVEGTVVLQLRIDESGMVRDVEVIEASPQGVFEQSARTAFSEARYAPAMRNGTAVRALVRIRVRFEMNGEEG